MSDLQVIADLVSGRQPLVWRFRTWVTVPATIGAVQLITGSGSLMALVMEETTGTASAKFTLYDGTDSEAQPLGPYRLAAGESIDNTYPPHGLVFRSGLYLAVAVGEVDGSAMIGTLVPVDERSESWGL